MELNQTVINQLEVPIETVWDQIGSDALEAFPDTDNEGAIELCIDASRLITIADNPIAQALVKDLVEEHGYVPVLKFLAKRIRLN